MLDFKSEKLADILIRILSRKRSGPAVSGDEEQVKVLCEFPAHRQLLASFSPWFEANLLWPAAELPGSQSEGQDENSVQGQPGAKALASQRSPQACRNQKKAQSTLAAPEAGTAAKRTPAVEVASQKASNGTRQMDDTPGAGPSSSKPAAGTARPHVEIIATEEEAVLIQIMIEHIYLLVHETSGLQTTRSAADILKPLSQRQLLGLLACCDYYGVHPCAKQAAAALQNQTLLLSTIIEIYELSDSLSHQPHMQPLLAAVKEKLMNEFGDLELAWADDEKRKAFCDLPFKAVTGVLSHPDTRIASEDTAAVAACSWLAAQSVAPSQQEVDALMGCLRLQWLSSGFRSMITRFPGYQPLHDYMQHPVRKAAVDFLLAWQQRKCDLILSKARGSHPELFKNMPDCSMRPKSEVDSLRLVRSITSAQVQAAVTSAQESDKMTSMCTDRQHFGGFMWEGMLKITKEHGLGLHLRWHPSHVLPISPVPIAKLASALVHVGSVEFRLLGNSAVPTVTSRYSDVILLPDSGRGINSLCKPDQWQKYVNNGELSFEVCVKGPPSL